jgi:hypothetical protein
MGKTLKEFSKDEPTADKTSIEVVVAGSLQRIADSMDIMAKDRVKLEQDLDWYKKAYARRGETITALENQIKGLKSAKSRFKNQLDKSKEKEI